MTAVAEQRKAVFHTLRVAAVEHLTDDAVRIVFEVPDELRQEYRFTAGQHLALRHTVAGDDVRRNYSISAPAASGRLEVAVKELPEGVFSTYALKRLQPGDTMEVMTPVGRFTPALDPRAHHRYVTIAAGSGIAPILSIIATVLEAEPQSEVTLIYGNRSTGSIMFLEELEDLKNRYATRFTLYHVLSREQQEVELFNGRIDAAKLERFLQTLVPPDRVDGWFLCGPPAMILAARDVLVAHGVDATRVHAEYFHAEGLVPLQQRDRPAGGAGESTVTVVLDGRSSTFRLAPDGPSILDAALQVRSDAPYACKGGVCGTCRSRVLEGSVTMDQCYALEDSEVAAGFVLACQSHPTSEQVTLEFSQ